MLLKEMKIFQQRNYGKKRESKKRKKKKGIKKSTKFL